MSNIDELIYSDNSDNEQPDFDIDAESLSPDTNNLTEPKTANNTTNMDMDLPDVPKFVEPQEKNMPKKKPEKKTEKAQRAKQGKGKTREFNSNPFICAYQAATNKENFMKTLELINAHDNGSNRELNDFNKYIMKDHNRLMKCAKCDEKSAYLFVDPTTKTCYCFKHAPNGCINLLTLTKMYKKNENKGC